MSDFKIKVTADLDASQVEAKIKALEERFKNYSIKTNVNLNGNGVNNLNSRLQQIQDNANGIARSFRGIAATKIKVDALNFLKNQTESAIQSVTDLNKAMTLVSMTMSNMSSSSLNSLKEQSLSLAKDLSTYTKTVTDAVTIYANENESAASMLAKAQPTVLLSAASGMSASSSADAIQGIMNQFNLSEDQAMHIADVTEKLSSEIALDFSKGCDTISQSIATSGSVVNEAGMSFEKYAALVSTTAEKTRQSGSQIGNAFKTIFSRISRSKDGLTTDAEMSKAEEAFKSVGVSVRGADGDLRDVSDTLDDLNQVWGTLNHSQKSYVAEQAAGVKQKNIFEAAMDSYSKALQLEQDALNSDGTAMKINEKRADSINGRIEKLSATMTKLYSDAMPEEAVNGMLDLATAVAKVVDNFGLFQGALSSLGVVGGAKIISTIASNWTGLLSAITSPVGITSIVTGGAVAAISAYRQSVQEMMESAKQAGSEWESGQEGIQGQIDKVTELRTALDSGTLSEQEAASAKSELLSIQESLTESYGSQVAGIDLINGSLTEQIDLLDKVSQKQAEQFQNENKKGIDKATKEVEKKRHTYAGRFYDDGSDEAEAIKASVKKLQDTYGDEVVKLDKSADGITTDIHINADASQAIEVFNDFMNEISDVQKTYGESDMTNLMLDNASVGLTSAKDVLDEYQDLYNQAQKAKLVAEDDLYKAPSGEEQTAVKWLNDYANAVEKYNDALSNGDTDAIKEASTEFNAVDSAVQSLLKNSDMSEFADQFTEVRDQLNESAISANKFNEALSGNDSSKFGKEVKKNADALKELNLTDTDFKYAFETDGIQEGEDAVNSLVDSALECGLISDTSSEQVSKLVNVLSSLGVISSSTGEAVDTTTEAVSGLEGQVTDAQNAYNNLSTAMSESMSDTGLTADSISNIKSDLQSVVDSSDELKDFDLNSLFTNTAKGVKLNNDKLEDMLELQHDLRSKDFADSISKQNDEIKEQEKALKELTEGTDEYTTAQEKLNDAKNQLAETKQAQSQYHAIYQQQQEMFSEYAQWQQAQSTENAGDKYNNLYSGLKTAKDAYDKGLVGTDDFKTFAKMLSPSGSTDPENFAENYGKAARYITEDESGLVHFFEDLSTKTDAAGNQMAKFNDQTQQWELNVHDLGEVAQKLGTGETVVEALFGRAEDYGATSTVISDMEDGVLKTTEAIQNKAEAQARLNQMEEANKQAQTEGKDDIYNTTAIEAARQEVEKYQAQIDGLKESMEYFSEHSITEDQAKQAKTATDEIKSMKQEYDSLMKEANDDTESTAYKTAQQLKDSIQQKANESNLVLDAELNVTGVKASAQEGLQKAQESGQISSDINLDYDKSSMSLDQLNSKIQELNNEKVRIQTEADTSGSEETLNQLDTEISALQNQRIQVEIDTALNNGNTVDELLAMTDTKLIATVGCDASEVDAVRSELQTMQGESITMSVKMDSTQFASLINTIAGKPVEVPVEANTDGAVQETTSAIEGANPKVTPEVDTSNVESATQSAVQNAAQGATVELPSVDIIGHVTEITAGQGLQDVAIKGNVVQISGNPSQPVDITGNVTNITGNPSGQVDVTGNIKSVNPYSGKVTVNAKANVTTPPEIPDATVNVTPEPSEVEVSVKDATVNVTPSQTEIAVNAKANVIGTTGENSQGTINYKKGNVEKADGTTSQGIINYKKGDVEKADGTVSTGVINYNLGNVAIPKGMTATGVINYTLGSVAKPAASGTFSATRAYAQGSLSDFFFSPAPAHASGDVALEQNETALVNEVGIESIVRDGRWSLLPGGAHFVNLKKGDIIFSASQTEDLLKRGATPGHARAYAQGSLSDFSLAPAHAVGGLTLGFSGGLKSPKYGNSGGGSSSTPSTTPANTSAQKSNTKATNDNTKATKKNTSAFDYVAQRLSYFANKTKAIADKITDYVSSAFKTTQLKKQMNAISAEINVNTKAAQAYWKKANSVDLTAAEKKAVREGKYSLPEYNTSSSGDAKTTYDKLNDYKKYYEEYVKCTQAVQELKNQQMELFEQWANMPTEEAEKKLERLKNGFKGLTAIQARINVANLGGSTQALLNSNMTSVLNSAKSDYKNASTKQKSAKTKYSNAVKAQNKAQTQANKDSKAAKSAASKLTSAKGVNLTDDERKRISSGQTISTKGLTGKKKTLVQRYNTATRKNNASKKKLNSAKSATTTAKSNLKTANANYAQAKSVYTTYADQYKQASKYLSSGDTVGYQNYLADLEVSNLKSQNNVNQAAYKQATKNRVNIQRQKDAADPKKIRANAQAKAKTTGASILKKNSKKLTKSQQNALKNGTKVSTKGVTDKNLLKQLNAYNKALENAEKKANNSRTKYNQLAQQLTIAQNAEAEAAATAAESEAEYAQKAIEAEKTKFENISDYYDKRLDYEKALIDKSEKERDLASAHGDYTESGDYDSQISNAEKQMELQAEKAKKLQEQLDKSVKSGKIKEGSDEWLEMKTQILEADSAVDDYATQIENLKQQQITTKYEEMFDRAIDKADKFITKLNSIDDLISDDMKYDYETGELTEFGALSIALNAKELDSQIENIKKYTQKRKQIMDDFANGAYGEQKYDELMAENDSNLQSAIKNASNYRDAIVKIVTSQAQAVQDALFKVMDARKKALQKKKEYFDYDKQLKNKTSEIQLLDQQIAALDGLTDAESKAMKAKLEAQRKEKQEDLDDTVRDHVYDLQIDGLDDLKDQLSEDFEKWSKELASNLDKTTEVINKAVNSVGNNTAQVMDALAQVLKAYGVEPSDVLTNSDLNKLDGYASGTKRVGGVPRLAMTNEKGREILVTKKGILTPIEPSDGIINHDMTETLMQMAMDYKGFEMPEVIMPNIEIVNKGESDGGNISIHYDSLLTVQGDVTKDALPDLKTILKQASEYTQNDIRKNRRRFG